MALDPTFIDPLLDTYRNMAKEVTEKGAIGEDYDNLMAAMHRMESLTQELEDLNEFYGLMMQENLYMKFSDAYTRVLIKMNSAKYQLSGTEYGEKEDGQLLKQTLDAYRDAINRLVQAKKDNIKSVGAVESKLFNEESFIKPIRDLIALGESGISYPKFLSEIIVRGLDKAMQGSINTRDALVFSKDHYAAYAISRIYNERESAILEMFDKQAGESKIGSPDPLQFELACDEIRHHHEPMIEQWKAVKERWEKIIDNLSWWMLSYCSFAPQIQPWAQAANPRKAVRQTQDCNPGELEVLLAQFKRYFGMEFNDIFNHETFVWDVKWNHLWHSFDWVSVLKNEVFPHAKPGGSIPADIISKIELVYNGDRMRNPELHLLNERVKNYYNGFFGDGYYEKKNPGEAIAPSKASVWKLPV